MEFLKEGFLHITDWEGYDHMLFIMCFAAIYQLKNIKALLILVSAFTIGHTITLALSVLNVVSVSSDLVELLIAVTILITALANIYRVYNNDWPKKVSLFTYATIFIFGLVHGLGFSNYLRMLLAGQESIFVELLSFTIGMELGQLLILVAYLVLVWIWLDVLKLKRYIWAYSLSFIATVLSIMMIWERI